MNESQANHLIKVLHQIRDLLATIIDKKKKTLRMVDVERGKVYKTHLGRGLSARPTTPSVRKRKQKIRGYGAKGTDPVHEEM